jgi:hypothetical protein
VPMTREHGTGIICRFTQIFRAMLFLSWFLIGWLFIFIEKWDFPEA